MSVGVSAVGNGSPWDHLEGGYNAWRVDGVVAISRIRTITNASRYFDAIAEAFPDLLLVDPPQLRTKSLLGSGTTLQALAGAWYDLTKTTSANDEPVRPLISEEDVTEFFRRLAPHMGAPIRPRNKWRSTGAFPGVTDGKPVMAPSSRTQDLKALSNKIRAWALQDEPLPF